VGESAPPDHVGFAFGLAINKVAIIGNPPLLGLLRDSIGNYVANWTILITILAL